jgi:type IV secretory pathway protease TraF
MGSKDGMAEARRPARAAVPLIVHPASALVFAVGVCLLLWVALAHFRLNVSPSVPLGVYRVHRVPDRLDRGMLVLVSVPDRWKTIAFARGWVHEPWCLTGRRS